MMKLKNLSDMELTILSQLIIWANFLEKDPNDEASKQLFSELDLRAKSFPTLNALLDNMFPWRE